MNHELIYLTDNKGMMRAWIRKANIYVGDIQLPYFYLAYSKGSIYEHCQMIDDFGNLFSADVYELIRGNE